MTPRTEAHPPGIDRRRFLKLAGLAGLGSSLQTSGFAEDPKLILPNLPAGPPRLICGNAPFGGAVREETPDLTTQAVYDEAKLWPIGDTIRVHFLNGKGDPFVEAVQQHVRTIAPAWSDYANLRFSFTDQTQQPDRYDLLVNFYPFYDSAGNYYDYGLFSCYLGTDTKAVIQKGIWSMNLLFNPTLETPESERRRLILHEFGHATGLIHEHQRSDGPAWTEAVYTYFANRYRWNRGTVEQQVISKHKGGRQVGTKYDVRSIMEYEYPPGLAYYKGPDGRPDYNRPFSAPNNTDLTAMDKVAASITYPKAATRLEEMYLTLGQVAEGSIRETGQVAKYHFQTEAEGQYTVEATGNVLLAVLETPNPNNGRGLPNNICGAIEPFSHGNRCNLRGNLPANKSFYIEIRDQKPMRTLPSPTHFQITVRQGV